MITHRNDIVINARSVDSSLYDLAVARDAALEILKKVECACYQIAVAGSIRRGVKRVHDIDLVAWPKYEASGQMDLFGEPAQMVPNALINLLKRHCGMVQYRTEGKIIRTRYADIPLELYLVEPNGSNWGAMLQMRTGSEAFNVKLAMLAQERGYRYRAGYGVFDMRLATGEGETRVDDDSEEGILKALRVSSFYLDPRNRIT